LAIGSVTLKATYDGDAGNLPGSNIAAITVKSVAVTCTPVLVVGKPTTCTATLAGSNPFMGKMIWSTSGAGKFSPASAACKLSKTKGSCSVKYVPSSAGPVFITASYSPIGGSKGPASSGTFSLAVNRATSKTTLSCSPLSAKPGKTIRCTATVIGYHPTGTATWSQMSANGGSVTFGSSSCTTISNVLRCTTTMTGATAGAVTIQADYSDDANNLSSFKTLNLTIE
jgi:hypothetical protein